MSLRQPHFGYVGTGAPPLAVGIAAALFGAYAATVAFVAVIGALALGVTAALARTAVWPTKLECPQ